MWYILKLLYYTFSLFSDEDDQVVTEKIYSIAKPILRKNEGNLEEPTQIDNFDEEESSEALVERLREAEKLRSLFSKSYFWLSREVPKESLSFVIRSAGGNVCWEECPAKMYDIKSPMITHVIVDRPTTELDLRRKFVQPQWVYDSFNARNLLPEQRYAPSAQLPPHLSPFVEEKVGDYIPMERIEQLKQDGKGKSIFSSFHLKLKNIEYSLSFRHYPLVGRHGNYRPTQADDQATTTSTEGSCR